MKSIILSIHPKWAEMILSGEKNCELRRTRINLAFENYDNDIPTRCYLYATSPVKAIVGEVCITGAGAYAVQNSLFGMFYEDRIKEFSKALDEMKLKHCVNDEDVYSYFETARIAFCYRLDKPVRYDTPRSLSDLGINRAPQSWRYAKEAIHE